MYNKLPSLFKDLTNRLSKHLALALLILFFTNPILASQETGEVEFYRVYGYETHQQFVSDFAQELCYSNPYYYAKFYTHKVFEEGITEMFDRNSLMEVLFDDSVFLSEFMGCLNKLGKEPEDVIRDIALTDFAARLSNLVGVKVLIRGGVYLIKNLTKMKGVLTQLRASLTKLKNKSAQVSGEAGAALAAKPHIGKVVYKWMKAIFLATSPAAIGAVYVKDLLFDDPISREVEYKNADPTSLRLQCLLLKSSMNELSDDPEAQAKLLEQMGDSDIIQLVSGLDVEMESIYNNFKQEAQIRLEFATPEQAKEIKNLLAQMEQTYSLKLKKNNPVDKLKKDKHLISTHALDSNCFELPNVKND